MDITDEMVERAAAALYHDDPERLNWTYEPFHALSPATQDAWRSGARAALDAALGDVEPLEDVLLADGAVTVVAHMLPPQNGHDTRVAVEVRRSDGRRKDTHGTGPTIDAAIRAAVANAKGDA